MEEENLEFKLARKVWDKIFGQIFEVGSMDWSRKHEGIRYNVKRSGSDEWSCDCMSFKFKSGVVKVKDLKTGKEYDRTCKHIRFVMVKEGMKIKPIYA